MSGLEIAINAARKRIQQIDAEAHAILRSKHLDHRYAMVALGEKQREKDNIARQLETLEAKAARYPVNVLQPYSAKALADPYYIPPYKPYSSAPQPIFFAVD